MTGDHRYRLSVLVEEFIVNYFFCNETAVMRERHWGQVGMLSFVNTLWVPNFSDHPSRLRLNEGVF